MKGKKINFDGIKGIINIIDKNNIVCFFKEIKGMNEELKILKCMLDYIVDDLYNGNIDIREYSFKSICCDDDSFKYILEIVDWYS